jgi:hypothetical protein
MASSQHPTLHALAAAPRTIVAGHVFGDESLDQLARQEIWPAYGIEASLRLLAEVHAAIDFSNLDGTRQATELGWLGEVDDAAVARVRALVDEGQVVFSARSLIQCAKEAIEFGDADSPSAVPAQDILRCVLAVNQEHDRPQRLPELPQINDVDATSLQQVRDYFAARGEEFLDAERGELMVDLVASASFEHSRYRSPCRIFCQRSASPPDR